MNEICNIDCTFCQVAHNQVRNIGCVAGNLAMTHEHGEFASDVATILMAAGARLRLGFALDSGAERSVGLEEFFNLSLEGVVILEILVPIVSKNTRFLTYKVALRRVNAHALVNAGFKLEVDSKKGEALIYYFLVMNLCPTAVADTIIYNLV